MILNHEKQKHPQGAGGGFEEMKCASCGREITDDMDAWECDGCGAIVCEDCINGEGYCDNCAEEREQLYRKYHGEIF